MFRSCLFVPTDRPERFAKALAAGPDLVILDLEDAVQPAAKPAAREQIRAFLQGHSGARVGVRLNAAGTEWFQDDLSLLASPALAAVMLPKAETAETLAEVAGRLQAGAALIPLVETALGIWNALELARAPRVVQLAFGSVDFQLDAGLPDDDPDRAMLYARSRLVLASAAAGVAAPIDGVTVDLDDPARTTADVAQSRALGFGGKLCIHPRQIAPVHEGLAPSPAELARARAIVAAADAVGANGAIRLDGKLIDRPVAERARRMLAGG
ncbi:CoA ester lyase [Paracoccus solventivorans]|nr:CoA ester lyase [Paracoccus solventivorans]